MNIAKNVIQFSFLLLGAFPVVAQTSSSHSVTVKGQVTGNTEGYDYIYYYGSGMPQDSAKIVNGEFTITIPFKETFTPLFYTEYEIKSRHAYRPFPLLVDRPGTINLAMDIKEGFYHSKVSGNPTVMLYNDFLAKQSDVYNKINQEMEKLYGTAAFSRSDEGPTNVSRDSLFKIYMGGLVNDFLKAHPDDYVSAYLLGTNKYTMDAPSLEKSLSLLSLKQQHSDQGKGITAYLSGLKNAVVGKEAGDFVLNNSSDKPFQFSQLKGKYVWIDFWASWCGPCKAAFPHMKELYSKYKGDQFELVGISVDATKAPWLDAVNTIKNPWPQLWDNQSVANQFAVAAYPTSFLIGPDGKIILKEVGFEPDGPMEKKLHEIFGK